MRRLLAISLCAFLLAAGFSGMSGGATVNGNWAVCPIESLPTERSEWWPDGAVLEGAREAGFDWLDDQQSTDGSFSEDYGVTALVAFAMLNGGRDVGHPVVARALARVLAEAREDGSFSVGTYVHYYTSLAVMALSAGGQPQDEQLVLAGVDMLVRDQCDGDEEGFEEWWRGGIGYGGDGRPDMSNTQFALMALAAAEGAYPSVHVPEATWEQALLFVHRSQNLPEVNDLDWDDDASSPSYGDGGLIYHPGRSNAGGLDSYGSMTAAGVWCMLAAGEDTTSASTGAALAWLGERFSGTENPGIGHTGYYYYAWAAARALRTAGAPALIAPDGTQLYWARQLADGLFEAQSPLGYWVNTGSDQWWEGDPVVATCFALLSLEALMPAEDAGLSIRVPDGGRVSVTDPLGRKDGEIPTWSRGTDGTVSIDDPSSGPFSLEVNGADSVELASDVDGSVRVWREVGLARDGGRMTVDVAPLLGPASLVVANVVDLAPAASSSPTPGASVAMAVTAVVVLAAVTAIAVRARDPRPR